MNRLVRWGKVWHLGIGPQTLCGKMIPDKPQTANLGSKEEPRCKQCQAKSKSKRTTKFVSLGEAEVFGEQIVIHHHEGYKDPETSEAHHYISWYYGFWTQEAKDNLSQAEADQQEFVTETVRAKLGEGHWRWLDDNHGRRCGLWILDEDPE